MLDKEDYTKGLILLKGDKEYDDMVLDIAEKEVSTMSNEDRQYFLKHPNYYEHHYGYGMYLRNNYIHDKINVAMPDSMSRDIFESIISILRNEGE